MENKLSKQLHELKEINRQRKAWLILSAFVMTVIAFTVFEWEIIETNQLIWAVLGIGATVSAVWWYWTMRTLNKLIHQRAVETEVLYDMVNDIREIKSEVRDFFIKVVDKDK